MISPELLKKVGGVITKPTQAPNQSPTQPPSQAPSPGITVPNKGEPLDLNKLNLNDGSLSVISVPKKQLTGADKKAVESGKADAYNAPPTYKEPTFMEKVDYAINPTTGANKHTIGWFNALAGTKALSTLKDIELGQLFATKEAFDKNIKITQRIEQGNPFKTSESTKMMDTIQTTPEFEKLVTAHIVSQLENDTPTDKFIKNFANEMKKTAEYYQQELEDKKLKAGHDPKKESFGEKVAEAAPSAEMFAAVALATGGASTLAGSGYLSGAIALSGKVGMTITEAAMEADSARDQVLLQGGTEEEAIKTFNEVFGANVILIAATNKVDKIWDIDTYKTLKEMAVATGVSGVGEGFQEGVQQIISNTSTGRPVWEGVDEAFLIGAVLGGGVKGVTGVGGLTVENIREEIGSKGKEKVLEEILQNPDIPEDKKDAVKEILSGNPDEETVQGIMQDSFQDGSVQDFIINEQQAAINKTAEEEEMLRVYQQQVSMGIAPTVIYQEISDRTGIPVEEIESVIQELNTKPNKVDIASQVAQELADQHGIKLENTQEKTTPEDQIKSIAEEVIKQDEATAPEVVKDMENDAEAQQDWENNYRVEYGDLNMQETYLRGQNQRLVQKAAKVRVQQQIKQIEEKKAKLKEEFVKNNTETTKEDVKGALEEKNPKKANKVLNQVGKKKTLKRTKQGVRVARVEDVDKPTKKQLEKRAKTEGSFLDIKKSPTDFDQMTGEESDYIQEYNTLDAGNIVSTNPFETTIGVHGDYFSFKTDEFQNFVASINPEDLRYFVKGDTVYLIDTAYGDWNVNSIVGRVQTFTQQKETLFQRSSKSRFATQADINRAFEKLPILKDIRVEKVSEILTPQGRQAYGSYFDGVIKYIENPKYGTLPHEVFHATVDLVFTPEERDDLFALARQEMRKESYLNPSDIEVEEYLAEKFESYYHKIDTQSVFQKWLDKIRRFFQNVLGNAKTIDDYFNSVFDYKTGKMLLPNMNMTPIDGNFILELNPQTVEDAREIVNEAEITKDEKNFLQNVLDNPVYKTKKDLENLQEEIGIRTLQVKGELANTEIRSEYAKRGNEEIGLDKDTPSFYYALTTDVEHGQNLPHGIAPNVKNAVAWASVADTGRTLQVKEIQKLSGRALMPDLKNSNATDAEKSDLKKVHQQYMDFMVVMLRDKAALMDKAIYFPTPEKANRVNPQASLETIDKEYDQAMKNALDKFTEYTYVEDNYGGSYVIYPTEIERLNAHRFQTGDAFEIAQQNALTTKILNRLGERKTVSKQFVADLTKMPDIKQKEKELINEVLKGEPATIDVEKFKQKVRAELLPLTVVRDNVEESKGRKNQAVEDARNYLQRKGITMEEDMGGGIYPVNEDGEYLEYDELPEDVQRRITVLAEDYERNSEDDGGIENRYARISLSGNERGDVKSYNENVYESPIPTDAGLSHFSSSKNYFGHTRIEDMADGKTRRVIEVQSDLYQKGDAQDSIVFGSEEREYKSLVALKELYDMGVKNGRSPEEAFNAIQKSQPKYFVDINSLYELEQRINFLEKKMPEIVAEAKRKTSQINYYNNPSAHFRMVREEMRRAAKDGIKEVQFPTGETALKIEGHWDRYSGDHGWQIVDNQKSEDLGYENTRELKDKDIQVGKIIKDKRRYLWIIVDKKGAGEFVAVPYNKQFIQEGKEFLDGMDGLEDKTDYEIGQLWAEDINGHLDDGGEIGETFSIKEDSSYKKNPLYKFYESDLGKYLKNTFNAKEIVDENGVSWFQVEVKPEMKGRVEAFQEKSAFDRLAELFLKIQVEDRKVLKRERVISRISEEIGEEFQKGYYQPIQMRKELAKAEILYEQKKDIAIAIAKGEVPNTTDINDFAINRYALYQAVQNGNTEDQIKMIQNLSKTARQYGQNISLLRGSLTANSPVQYINQLIQAKVDLAKKQWKPLFKKSDKIFIEDVVDSEVKKIKRKKSTKDLREKLLKEKEFELDSFLESIKC